MPAVPKRRSSKARRDRRRSHDAIKNVNYVIDPSTGKPTIPHHADTETGEYKGKKIFQKK